MVTVLAIIGIIVFSVLLIAKPKPTLGCTAVALVVLGALFYGLIYYPSQVQESNRKKVQINIKFEEGGCAAGYPLMVSCVNASDKTVDKVSFHIEARIPGHSDDVSSWQEYSYDQILQPGKSWVMCYQVPPLKTQEQPASLEYRARLTSVVFQ